jgi:hypothetical protein
VQRSPIALPTIFWIGAISIGLVALVIGVAGTSWIGAVPPSQKSFSNCAELRKIYNAGIARSKKSARQAAFAGSVRPKVAKKVFQKNRKRLGPARFGSLCLVDAPAPIDAGVTGPETNHPVANLTAVWGLQPFAVQDNQVGIQFHNGLDYYIQTKSVPVIASMSGRLFMAEIVIRKEDGHAQLNLAWAAPTGEVNIYSLEPSAGPAEATKIEEQKALADRMLSEMQVRVGDTITTGQRLTTLYAQDDWAHIHWSMKTSMDGPEKWVCPADSLTREDQRELANFMNAWENRLYRGTKNVDLCNT